MLGMQSAPGVPSLAVYVVGGVGRGPGGRQRSGVASERPGIELQAELIPLT